MDAEQRQVAADLWTKPTDLSHRPACRQLRYYIHHRHLLLLSLKADTHFTITRQNDVRIADISYYGPKLERF